MEEDYKSAAFGQARAVGRLQGCQTRSVVHRFASNYPCLSACPGALESFLLDVLGGDGKDSNIVTENTHRYLAAYEQMFRPGRWTTNKRDEAVQRCRCGCKQRVLEELDQREGTETADHPRIV